MGKVIFTVMLMVMMLLSVSVFAQDPGGNPDGNPPAVPMEDYLLPVLAGLGLIVAFIFLRKRNKKRLIH